MNKKKIIELGTIKPSQAIGIEYARNINKLYKKMWQNILKNIIINYDNNILNNKNIITKYDKIFNDLFTKWVNIFEIQSEKLATNFIDYIDKHNKLQIKSHLNNLENKNNFNNLLNNLNINFSKENKIALNKKKLLIENQINLITQIPKDLQPKVQSIVLKGITNGRDIKYVEQELQQIPNITLKRAKRIAKNQLNYATEVINRQRQIDLGFTKAKWNHSKISKEPRLSHKKADGVIYEVEKGCYIDNEYIQPAEKYGCNCFSTMVIEL